MLDHKVLNYKVNLQNSVTNHITKKCDLALLKLKSNKSIDNKSISLLYRQSFCLQSSIHNQEQQLYQQDIGLGKNQEIDTKIQQGNNSQSYDEHHHGKVQKAQTYADNQAKEIKKQAQSKGLFNKVIGFINGETNQKNSQLILLLVSLLWGSFVPVLKLLYKQPVHPAPLIVNVLIYAIGAFFFSILLGINKYSKDKETQDIENIIVGTKINTDTIYKDLENLKVDHDISQVSDETLQTIQNNQQLIEKLQQQKEQIKFNLGDYVQKNILPGVELAVWEFAGQASIVIGLQYTTAVVCSLLGSESQQLLTPFFGTFLGERTSLFTWFCCILGMVGGGFIAADSLPLNSLLSGASKTQLIGDCCALGAALFFAIGNVRIGQRARQSESFQLSAVRSIFVAIFSVVMVIFYPGSNLKSFIFQILHCKTTVLGWGCIIWNGLVANSIALTLQLTGQRAVTAGQAQAIYSTVPLFGTLMAWGLLGEKFLGPYGKIGSVAVLTASLLPLIKLFIPEEKLSRDLIQDQTTNKKEE